MTFNLDLDLDLGLTIIDNSFTYRIHFPWIFPLYGPSALVSVSVSPGDYPDEHSHCHDDDNLHQDIRDSWHSMEIQEVFLSSGISSFKNHSTHSIKVSNYLHWMYNHSSNQYDFRIFYYLASVRRLISFYWCGVSKDECDRDMENQKNYKDIILRLLESKMFADFEKHQKDDLIKDLQNFIREEIKSSK